MVKILLALYLIAGGCQLVPDSRAPHKPFVSKQALLFEDLKEITKEPVKSKITESDTEPYWFQSGIKLFLFRIPNFKLSTAYLKSSPGYPNSAFAPPDLV